MSKEIGEPVRKWILTAAVGIVVFLSTDFILNRRLVADCNVRQDAEILSLRRDITRQERMLEDLRALSVEILKEVKK